MELPFFSYAHCHIADGRPVPFHHHYGCELILVTQGNCRIESPRGALEGQQNTLFVIPPGMPHNEKDSADEQNFYCVFQSPPDMFRQDWRTIDVSGRDWVMRYFQELNTMTEECCLEGASALLCSLLQRLNQLEKGNRELHPSLKTALEFMQRHYTEPITISEVAAKAGLSISSLRRLCQQFCSISPIKYLQSLRLKQSEILLRNPYSSISEVADQCGIGNSNYFIRLYRQKFGVTPKAARDLFALKLKKMQARLDSRP